MTPPIPLLTALKASVEHPDEVELYGRLKDIATVLGVHAEAIRQSALRGEVPSLDTIIGIISAIHVADAAALQYASSRGIYIKNMTTDPC